MQLCAQRNSRSSEGSLMSMASLTVQESCADVRHCTAAPAVPATAELWTPQQHVPVRPGAVAHVDSTDSIAA